MRHRLVEWFEWTLFLVAVGAMAAGCSDEDVEFQCQSHEECLDGEACLDQTCLAEPARGESCSEDLAGVEYEEIECVDGIWETRNPSPPEIETVAADPTTARPGGTIELNVEIDSDDDELDYAWSAPDAWELQPDDEAQVELTTPSRFDEEAIVQVEVANSYGEAATGEVTVSTVQWEGQRSFWTCEAEGQDGPDQESCDDDYSGTTLEGEVEVTGGIQTWEVPADGTYSIEATGAGGGTVGTNRGGGATASGDFELESGRQLSVLVGQKGEAAGDTTDAGASGGGGSFVVLQPDDEPLVVAGGAGGTIDSTQSNRNGNDGADGRPAYLLSDTVSDASGGSDGSGGETVAQDVGAGGGLLGAGQGEPQGAQGQAFVDGGEGGIEDVEGGFGGGGAAPEGSDLHCAGGGGYSGGGGIGVNAGGFCTGGGGGSFVDQDAENAERQAGQNIGHGEVVIDLVDGE